MSKFKVSNLDSDMSEIINTILEKNCLLKYISSRKTIINEQIEILNIQTVLELNFILPSTREMEVKFQEFIKILRKL
jgi:hypothetical protein